MPLDAVGCFDVRLKFHPLHQRLCASLIWVRVLDWGRGGPRFGCATLIYSCLVLASHFSGVLQGLLSRGPHLGHNHRSTCRAAAHSLSLPLFCRHTNRLISLVLKLSPIVPRPVPPYKAKRYNGHLRGSGFLRWC